MAKTSPQLSAAIRYPEPTAVTTRPTRYRPSSEILSSIQRTASPPIPSSAFRPFAATSARSADTPDDEYSKMWTMTQAGNEVFSAPKGTVMRSFVMNHIVHHRGQLTVFLRLNDVPLPMTYGPSADDSGGF